MRTFKAYLKKEVLEAARQYRYLIIFIGVVFFAIATPIMLRLLPKLLEAQMNADLSSFFTINRRTAIQNYIGDLVEISYLIIILVFSGTLSDELSFRKLVFPYSKGGSPAGMVFAKFLHNSLTTVLAVFVGFAVNYYYANIVISGEGASINEVMTSALLVSLYFLFGISLAMIFSSLLKKGLTAGIVTLAVSYSMIPLSGLGVLKKLAPYNLIQAANKFSMEGTLPVITATIIMIIAIIALTCYRMSRVEIIS